MSGPGNSGLPGVKESPDPGTNTPITPPGGTTPASVTTPTSTYTPYSPYSTPLFSLTPYSQYAGLAQQLAASMNPKITPYAAPRTQLTDMNYAPWNPIYGGPVGGTMPGSLPPGSGFPTTPPSSTTPPVPVGTPPVANRPPVTTTPPPPGTGAPPPPGSGGQKDLPPDYFGFGGASVNYNNYRGLPPPLDWASGNVTRQDLRNWIDQAGPAWSARNGYVRGAHGVTPESFKGTNAYKPSTWVPD